MSFGLVAVWEDSKLELAGVGKLNGWVLESNFADLFIILLNLFVSLFIHLHLFIYLFIYLLLFFISE